MIDSFTMVFTILALLGWGIGAFLSKLAANRTKVARIALSVVAIFLLSR